ncbi:hypothetical protein Zmor_025284 [Zophobas morio]|uniref:Uncharacterized protein n=1 Tax=Zophobas morio TaxID=2755281 RepID=A0AA38HRQ3_9CUCU|nr:hypothetical protein Zmor_025284 [Zophobas morio]
MDANSSSQSGTSAQICRKCKSKVVSALKCISCDNVYHLSCAKGVSYVKILDSKSLVCCDKVKMPPVVCEDSEFFEAMEQMSGPEKKVDIAVFNYIIKQKDEIIKELRDRVKTQSEMIDILIKSSNNLGGSTDCSLSSMDAFSSKSMNKNVSGVEARKVVNKSEPEIRNTIIYPNTNSCNEVDLNNSSDNGKNPSEKEVTGDTLKRRPKASRLIIGSADIASSSGSSDLSSSDHDFVAVTRKKSSHIHITRVNPNVDVNKITDYIKFKLKSHEEVLKNKRLPDFKLIKLDSKFPELYSSFKLTIDFVYQNDILAASFWPKGVAVRKFFQSKSIHLQHNT